ncbi:Hypothetical protein D9617_12g036450 [Elsinoe fawcettii]|nr:Hypothetical protein D9617_12g036450 [Elsinoe fawcettii]
MKSRSAHSVLHHAHLHGDVLVDAPTLGSQTINKPPTVVKRAQNPADTCGDDRKSPCPLPTDSGGMGKITIGLAAAIPILVAVVVLFFLHRRIKRKMKHEDAHDKHKSLDFGLDVVDGSARKKGKKGKPEMSIHTGPSDMRRNRGMSMDMDYANPYLLPAGVHGSRDSLHSMSRGLSDPNDPYRPVTFVSDNASFRSPSRLRNDNGSIYTAGGYSERSGSTTHKAGLLQNAARMPHDSYNNTPDMHSEKFNDYGEPQQAVRPPRKQSLVNGKSDRWYPADDPKYGSESPPDLSNVPAQTPKDMLSEKNGIPAFPQAARYNQPSPVPEYDEKRPFLSEQNDHLYAEQDALRITVPSPAHNRQSPPRSPNPLPALPIEPEYQQEREPAPQYQERHEQHDFDIPPPPIPKHNSDPHENHLALPGHDVRRVSVMGTRPLPPDDPSEDPEMRANRIRSFYREYFDDSKPNPAGYYPPPVPAPHDPYGYGAEDDYYGDFLDDGAVYDPETGAFYTNPHQQAPPRPFAEPMARRAMTPPPRAPGHFMRGHRSAMSTQSAGRRPMMQPKKQLPPPKPLQSLPTPHMLRDDTSILDFAPPSTFRDHGLGRAPDSPKGTQRPYSPAFRAHTPLGHSFDDLAVMPSPHALRKSGTFTALDFAPPPRFRDRADSASDAGSIRSNRSGLSAVQRNAIRQGAYRISRLPTGEVGTQNDMQGSLKPKWDIGR